MRPDQKNPYPFFEFLFQISRNLEKHPFYNLEGAEQHWQKSLQQADLLFDDLTGDSARREHAFGLLRGKLIRTIGFKLKEMYSVDDAFVEDVTQDTLMTVLDKLNTFRGESSFFTWVCAIAVRLAMTEVRRKRFKDYSLDALSEETAFDPPASGDFTDKIDAADSLSTVTMSIRTALTDKQRVALLAELDGLTTDEIARHFGTTRGAIYKLTHDARKALVKDLRKKGFDMEAALDRTA